MATLDNTYNDKTVSFKVYPSAVLTSDFTNVLILGVVTSSIANGFSNDSPATLHADVYSYLPSGTPNDYTAYNYALIQFPNGNRGIVGIPWIDPNSLVEVSGVTIKVAIPNQSITNVDTVRQILLANGISEFTITTT